MRSAVMLILAAQAAHAGPLIVAHRGASADAPENTLAAFRLAWERGADAVEGDFYLTKDKQIVCTHDATTKRTAGVSRRVADCTLAELKQLDVGSWKGDRFQGERMPTLAEVMKTVPAGKQIFVEVKCGPEIAGPLKTAIASSGLKAEQVTIISFNRKVIAAAKKLMPAVEANWLTGFYPIGRGTLPAPQTVLATLARCGADGLGCQAAGHIDAAFVKRLRDKKFGFHVWTVDDARVAKRFADLGVDSITTNRPAFIRKALR